MLISKSGVQIIFAFYNYNVQKPTYIKEAASLNFNMKEKNQTTKRYWILCNKNGIAYSVAVTQTKGNKSVNLDQINVFILD